MRFGNTGRGVETIINTIVSEVKAKSLQLPKTCEGTPLNTYIMVKWSFTTKCFEEMHLAETIYGVDFEIL